MRLTPSSHHGKKGFLQRDGAYYLVKVNNWFRMDADELQARSVALE